jgi:adenylate cyclase
MIPPQPSSKSPNVLPDKKPIRVSYTETLGDNSDELQTLKKQVYFLKFSEDNLEQEFQDFLFKPSIIIIRWALSLLFISYALFGLLDLSIEPSIRNSIFLIRYGIVCPFILITFILSFFPIFKKITHLLVSLTCLLAGLGIVAMAVIFPPMKVGYNFYFPGMALMITASYFTRIKVAYSTIVGWILSGVYALKLIIHEGVLSVPNGIILLINTIFFLAFFNFLGMFGSYWIELSARIDFLQRRAIEFEKNKSEMLLLNILPKEIALILKNKRQTIATEFTNTSILFADLVGFTPLSETLTPWQLVELLDELFCNFDQLVDKHELEKIKTIGDCYMVASGVPTPREDHAEALAMMALEMMNYINNSTFYGEKRLNLRIGINSGPVVAGVIGRKKFVYDLWGDTVNTASRMESHSPIGKIQITRETYELIKDKFECEYQGKIMVKGKGEMDVWYLQKPKTA